MKRWLIIGGSLVAAVVVVIVVVVVFVLSNIDTLVQEAVEEIGSEATQAKVTLDEVDISITSGTGALRGLTVGNPAGFKTAHALRLGEVSITLDVDSVTEDVIVIKEIVIAAPQVTYELGSDGSNLDALQRNAQAFMERHSGEPGKQQTTAGGGDAGDQAASSGGGAKQAEDEPEVKIVIENLYIRDGEASVSATMLEGRKVTVPLPSIHLTDIGKEDQGATPAEIADQILSAITAETTQAVASLGIEGLFGEAAKNVEGLK